MRILLEALDSHIIVTESYMIARSLNILKEGMSFTVGDQEVNWGWLFKGEGWNWLMENRDWFKNDGHYDHLKKEDEVFLDEYGFTDLFEEFDVSYVNVTDEVWSRLRKRSWPKKVEPERGEKSLRA